MCRIDPRAFLFSLTRCWFGCWSSSSRRRSLLLLLLLLLRISIGHLLIAPHRLICRWWCVLILTVRCHRFSVLRSRRRRRLVCRRWWTGLMILSQRSRRRRRRRWRSGSGISVAYRRSFLHWRGRSPIYCRSHRRRSSVECCRHGGRRTVPKSRRSRWWTEPVAILLTLRWSKSILMIDLIHVGWRRRRRRNRGGRRPPESVIKIPSRCTSQIRGCALCHLITTRWWWWWRYGSIASLRHGNRKPRI